MVPQCFVVRGPLRCIDLVHVAARIFDVVARHVHVVMVPQCFVVRGPLRCIDLVGRCHFIVGRCHFISGVVTVHRCFFVRKSLRCIDLFGHRYKTLTRRRRLTLPRLVRLFHQFGRGILCTLKISKTVPTTSLDGDSVFFRNLHGLPLSRSAIDGGLKKLS